MLKRPVLCVLLIDYMAVDGLSVILNRGAQQEMPGLTTTPLLGTEPGKPRGPFGHFLIDTRTCETTCIIIP